MSLVPFQRRAGRKRGSGILFLERQERRTLSPQASLIMSTISIRSFSDYRFAKHPSWTPAEGAFAGCLACAGGCGPLPEELKSERVGVFIGSSALDHGNLFIEDPALGSPHFMTGNTLSIIANRVSHVLGLSGPSMTIDTACSSSLVALAEAERALLAGAIDTAIVGVNLLLHPFSFVGFSQARMLSPEGLCRAYGQNGEGYVRAEGVGAVILRHSERVAAQAGAAARLLLRQE